MKVNLKKEKELYLQQNDNKYSSLENKLAEKENDYEKLMQNNSEEIGRMRESIEKDEQMFKDRIIKSREKNRRYG